LPSQIVDPRAKADKVSAVVSCKSVVDSIDSDFPKALRKHFNIKNVFLFGEAIKPADKVRLKKRAKKCGYKGLWWLNEIQNGEFKADPDGFIDFLTRLKAVLPYRNPRPGNKSKTRTKRQRAKPRRP